MHIDKQFFKNILLVPNSLWLVPTIRIIVILGLMIYKFGIEIFHNGKILYCNIQDIFLMVDIDHRVWKVRKAKECTLGLEIYQNCKHIIFQYFKILETFFYSHPQLYGLKWFKSRWIVIWLRHRLEQQNIICQYSIFQSIVNNDYRVRNVLKSKEVHIRLGNISKQKNKKFIF